MLQNILYISNKHFIQKQKFGMGEQEYYGGGKNIMAKSRNNLTPANTITGARILRYTGTKINLDLIYYILCNLPCWTYICL